MTQKEISAKHYRERKENGLCPRCGKPLDRKGFYCSSCCKVVSEYTRKNREFYRKNNICPECGKNKLFGDEKTCPECRAKAQMRKANYTEEQKQKYIYKYYDSHNKKQKNIYKERVEKGICTRCGKRKAAYGKRKCSICQNKENEAKRKRNGNEIRRRERPKYNLCYLCGGVLDREGGLCKKCAEKQASHLPVTRDNKLWREDNKSLFKN